MTASELGPYRDSGVAPVRHVCLVCYKTYAFGPSACPKCRLERLPIDRREVFDAVLAEALRRTDDMSDGVPAWRIALVVAGLVVPFLGPYLDLRDMANRNRKLEDFPQKVRAELPSYTGDQLVDFLKMQPK